jgi:hypothetical protein
MVAGLSSRNLQDLVTNVHGGLSVPNERERVSHRGQERRLNKGQAMAFTEELQRRSLEFDSSRCI